MTTDRPPNTSPRVPAIVIFRNAERFFDEAIESILAQDFDDGSFLLVDDGSTDASGEIARRHVERDPSASATSRTEGARTAA